MDHRDPLRGAFKVLVTGPHGFERTIYFAAEEAPGVGHSPTRT